MENTGDSPDETLAELREKLAQSATDLESAGLYDAIGIKLSEANRHTEALEECKMAVVLREQLVKDDSTFLPQLASSLHNLGGHLTLLGRYYEALEAYARSFEILEKLNSNDSAILQRIGNNAERMSILSMELKLASWGARFQGVAYEVFKRLSDRNPNYLAHARTHFQHLIASLDFHPHSGINVPSDVSVDIARLDTLGKPSQMAARALSFQAQSEFEAGKIPNALQAAKRTVRYCALFDSTEPEKKLLPVYAENLLNIAKWSIATGVEELALASGKRALKYYETWVDFVGGEVLADCRCAVGILYSQESLELAKETLSSAASDYEILSQTDQAKYLPRYAECLEYLYLLFARNGQAGEATAVVAKLRPVLSAMQEKPIHFNIDRENVLQRRNFLQKSIPDRIIFEAFAEEGLISLDEIASKANKIVRDQDLRLWSCNGQQLSLIMGDLLERLFISSDVHNLGKRLKGTNTYIARDLHYRCLQQPPQIFITYTWTDNFVDLQVAIRSVLEYIRGLILLARPELDFEFVDSLVHTKLGIWVDFIFIDQSSRDLVNEIHEVLPKIIEGVDLHFVLSDSAMLRSWCCYEVALFNKRPSTEELGQRTLRSFIARSESLNYQSFSQTSTTNPEDKVQIDRYIQNSYPDGMPGFEFILKQASMLSDSFIFKGFAQSDAAIRMIDLSIDKWISL